ncbi:hypothetical protein EIP91_003161 [Steccherinum ochraceum]|uniref:Cytochrome P450 n=1 Tax=Steccherinum ochraceum TaxID=92696 RepID=A0A4R0S2J8_9APHY|nr:hypothetical protein EIP91_003161 [Steccherinum ochraceum]
MLLGPLDIQPLVVGAAVLVYLVYKNYEPASVPATLALQVALPGALVLVVQRHNSSVLLIIIGVYSTYYGILAICVLGYRLSPTHPLASFPGPVGCRVSKLWMAHKATYGNLHEYVRGLHAKYGDIVRVGPNELSVRHEDPISRIMKDCPKGPYGITDLKIYPKRRRSWNRGTSVAAVKDYEEFLASVIRQLIGSLEERQGQTIDLSKWMIYTAFDFMGEMALSRQFNNVKTGTDTTGLIHAIEVGVTQLAWAAQIPWSLPFLSLLGKMIGDDGSWRYVQRVSTEAVKARIEAGSGRRDLFHHLMDGDDLESVKPPMDTVASDGALAIVAGSDTSATALSHCFYFLLRNPKCMQRLREEIESIYPGATDTTLDFAQQAEMPYLNACINEAMRLYPPVLTGLQKLVTSPTMIDTHYVPAGSLVYAHHFTIHRDSRYFYPVPDEFWPDRWLVQDTYTVLPSGEVIPHDQLIHNRNVFVPFSIGTRICAGKSIAYLEMRAVLCALIQMFDVTKAPGFALDQWEDNVKDMFITFLGPLMVNIKAKY